MDKLEPSFVPEWLKGPSGANGAVGAGTGFGQPTPAASSTTQAPPTQRDDTTFSARNRSQPPFSSGPSSDRDPQLRYTPPVPSYQPAARRPEPAGGRAYGSGSYSSHAPQYNSQGSYSGFRPSPVSHQEGKDVDDSGTSRYGAPPYRPPGSYATPYRPNSGYRAARDDRDSGYESRSDRDRWDSRDSRIEREREVNATLPRREPTAFGVDRERREDVRAPAPAALAPERSTPARAPVEGTVNVQNSSATLQKASFDRDFPTLSSKIPTFGQGSTIASPGGGAARPLEKQRWQSSSSGVGGPKLSQTSNSTSTERWTSRLAEAPPPGSSFLQNGNSGAAAIAAAAAAAAAAAQQSTTPKMADALQHVADTHQHSPADLARLEQLALRQSRQLVPVAPSLPGKGREKANSGKAPPVGRESPAPQVGASSGVATNPVAPAGSTVVPGPVKRPPSKETPAQGLAGAARRSDDAPAAVISTAPKRTPVLLDRHALPIAPTSSVVGSGQSTRVGLVLGGANSKMAAERAAAQSQEERQRMEHVRQDRSDFFQSLRSKRDGDKKDGKDDEVNEFSSSYEAESGYDSAYLSEAIGSDVAAAELQALPGERSYDSSVQETKRDATFVQKEASDHVNGNAGLVEEEGAKAVELIPEEDPADPVVSEEEARFLRSLGWDEGEEEGEEEEGGLTEEEIAAFKARLGGGASSKPIGLSTPVVRAKTSHHIGSLGSVGSDQLSSSDSDSD